MKKTKIKSLDLSAFAMMLVFYIVIVFAYLIPAFVDEYKKQQAKVNTKDETEAKRLLGIETMANILFEIYKHDNKISV